MNYHVGFFGRLLVVTAVKGDKGLRLTCVNGVGRRYVFLCPPDTQSPPFPVVIEFSGVSRWVGSTKDGVLIYFETFDWQEYEAGK